MKTSKFGFAELARFLDSLPSLGGWPGNDCLVMLHGEPVFRRQAGFADLAAQAPMTGRERVNLYSCSKIATCTAALQLFEKGLYKLDDPLADYMPEFADMKVMEDGVARPAKGPIRVWHLFTQILCAVWLGGGGTVMVFGLYSSFGNTAGAWCSLAFGSGFSLFGLVLQRVWAAHVVPWLSLRGWTESVFRFFADVSRPLNPYVDWSFGFNSGESSLEQALALFREKLFINSTEIYGLSMVLSIAAYCLGSYIALKAGWCRLYDLDKLLHRGKWADEYQDARHETPDVSGGNKTKDTSPVSRLSPKYALSFISRTLQSIVGIDDEYTRADKAIAWASFLYMFVWRIGIATLGVMFWNMAHPLPVWWWGEYYYVMTLCIPMVLGLVCTVWFIWGGVRDLIRLFRDLDARVRDMSDNGMVGGCGRD
jgi:hypothetical protein